MDCVGDVSCGIFNELLLPTVNGYQALFRVGASSKEGECLNLRYTSVGKETSVERHS